MRPPRLPAILGGTPISDQPLKIVRPRFPHVDTLTPAFQEALASGNVTNGGQHVVAFEAALSRYTGGEAVVTNNGQSALMIMLRAAGVDGGEVIVPSFTFAATPAAVRWCGAEPVFADIKADGTLGIDPEDVARRVTPRTRAIVGVEVYGVPCDYAALAGIAERHGLALLFDTAQAFGARVCGVPMGTFGHAQAFSFHATKAFTSMEGGCVVTRDPALAARARRIRNFGLDDADSLEPGINGKMLEICALVGLANLERLDEDIAWRNRIAGRMRAALDDTPGLRFVEVPAGMLSAWLYFPVFLDARVAGLDRDQVATALTAENLYVRKYFERACHTMTAYTDAAAGVSLPRTEDVIDEVFCLPIYNDMTEHEADLFVHAVLDLLHHADAVRAVLAR